MQHSHNAAPSLFGFITEKHWIILSGRTDSTGCNYAADALIIDYFVYLYFPQSLRKFSFSGNLYGGRCALKMELSLEFLLLCSTCLNIYVLNKVWCHQK